MKYDDLEPAKTILRTFLKEIEEVKAIRKQMSSPQSEEFKRENSPLNADGQVLRVLNRFALIAAAGTLATELGITKWPQAEAFWATKICFDAWLISRGGTTAQEGQEVLRQIRHFFEQHGDSRFTIIGDDDQRVIINRAGYKKWDQETGAWTFFVLSESFKQDICSGFDVSVASTILIEKGWLIPDSEGKSTRAEKLPCSENTTRCYRFSGGKLFADDI